MNTQLVRDIRKNMESRSSQQLVGIWVKNDRTEYSAEAFEAIRLILRERSVDLPSQMPPITSDENQLVKSTVNWSELQKSHGFLLGFLWFLLAVFLKYGPDEYRLLFIFIMIFIMMIAGIAAFLFWNIRDWIEDRDKPKVQVLGLYSTDNGEERKDGEPKN